jgi:hypothetical protein
MHYRGSCRLVYNQGPELHLDLVGQQEPVLILDVSTLQGRVLHLDYLYYCTIEACAAAGLVYSTEACAASGHVNTLGPELHMDMSSPQRPVPTYSTVEHVHLALKIICLLLKMFALTLIRAAIKKSIEWRLQVQIALLAVVNLDLAPSRPE